MSATQQTKKDTDLSMYLIDSMLFQQTEEVTETHHSHSIRLQQLLRGHGGEVGNVGESIDERHKGDGDVDCTWKVPSKVTITHHLIYTV